MHLIPTYPAKIPLELAHKEELQPYLLERRHGISEFSMASLFPFTKKRHYTVSAYTNTNGEKAFIIFGLQWDGDKEETFAMLPSGYPGKELFQDLFTKVDEINTISEVYLAEWEHQLQTHHPNMVLEEDRDNADYIYDRKSLIDLVGQSLHKKLAHALRFAEENPHRVLLPAHLARPSDMIRILDSWSKGRDLIEDYKATVLAIENQQELGLRGMVLYTDDIPVAFTLGEPDGESRFVIHFEKADTNYRGIYQYINRAFVADLPESVKEVNREQDLGIPGLRQAKLTYQPKHLLMKYKIRTKD